ncbi:MAG TPA: hypothetical protein VJ831_10605, partial [Jatrophihabitantaceae bacterium]|nr:hypothetical protein [Jatrophihabitantaceae bacterium]
SDCTTVAISFQVVLVVGQADVVVPQNLSGALNYNCLDCVTGALAMQLVVSVPENPSADMVTALNALWQQIADFSKNLEGLSFQEIHDRLVEYETQIVDVIQQYAPASASVSSSAGVAVSGAVVSGSSTTADASVSSSTSSSSANSATSPVATSTTPTDSGTAPTPTLTPTPTATP